LLELDRVDALAHGGLGALDLAGEDTDPGARKFALGGKHLLGYAAS
jgi:hypothetical protein